MEVLFDNNIPIYIQLVDELKTAIISGNIKAGERLPSVRELALQIKVNPNTVQKALAELEMKGLIYTQRTNGKFVTEDKDLIEKLRCEYASSLVLNFISSMESIGIEKKDIIKYLNDYGGNK